MSPSKPKDFITVVKKRSKLDELWGRRTQIQLQLRTLNRRLEHAHEWMPLVTTLEPEKKPALILKNLQEKKVKLMRALGELQKQGIGEPQRRPLPPLPDGGGLPDRKRLSEMVIILRELDKLYGVFERGGFSFSFDDEEPSCPSWANVLWAYELKTFPEIRWSDDDASYSGDWLFDPYYDIRRGIIGQKGWVSVESPPFYAIWDDPHHAQLTRYAALTFEIPAPECDSNVFYEAELLIGLNTTPDSIDSSQWYLISNALLNVQPDASSPGPAGLADFEWIEPRIEMSDSFQDPRIRSSHLTGQYFARQGVPSKVHIGFHWNLSVTNGSGGTCGGWDNFIIFCPAGSNVWGLKVSIIPV